MLAKEYAEYYGIEPQQESEEDFTFRSRVATKLREMGKIIEAHEAYHDERYETSDSMTTGVLGAVALALHGKNYRGDPIGNDIAAGVIAQKPKDDDTALFALLSTLLK